MGDRDRVVRKGGQKSCQKAVRKSGKKRRPLGGGGVKWEASRAGEILDRIYKIYRIKKEQAE